MTNSEITISVEPERYSEIRDTVAKICAGFPGSYWRGLEDKPLGQRFPTAFVKSLGEAGLLAAMIPEAYGGSELPLDAGAAIIETIHASGCDGGLVIAQFHLASLIENLDNEALKQTVLPALGDGSKFLMSLAHEEFHPDDMGGLRTVAEASGDHYAISGDKTAVVAVLESDFILISASHANSTGLFLVRVDMLNAPGVAIVTPVAELTNSHVADLKLVTLAVPREHAVLDAADALERSQTLRRILEASAAIGDGHYFSGRGVRYAKERVVFGKPIGTYQGIQFPLAKAHIEVEAAAIALRKALALFEAGETSTTASAVAHYLAVEAAWAMAEAAFTTHGGFAFAREYDIERKWRDARAARLAQVPYDNDLSLLGQQALGLPRAF